MSQRTRDFSCPLNLGNVKYYKEKMKKFSGVRYSLGDIVGSHSATIEIRAAILKAANTNATVLIQGETGTGKELVAHALHQESRRSPYPFVKLNCAAIPQDLIESELFGYDEGAFTGAHRHRQGRFEEAVDNLEQAVAKEPANAEINDHLGDAYWQVGRRREAGFQWNRVLTLDTDDERRAEVERKLREGLHAGEET